MEVRHSYNPVSEPEVAAVRRVLRSGRLNDGPEGEGLVEDLRGLTGAAGGTVASTGTHALALALRACGVRSPDDEVILPDYACRVLYDAVRLAGGSAVVADIREEDLSIDPDDAERRITAATRAVIVPHMFGLPADVVPFARLGIPVVEDCAHTVGVPCNGSPVGGIGDFAAFSFEGTKLVAAGEGGAVLARTAEGADRLRMLKREDRDGALACRLSDLVAALARARLLGLEEAIRRRREIAQRYTGELADLEGEGRFRLPFEPEGRMHAYYRYVVRVRDPDGVTLEAARRGVRIPRPIVPGRLSATLTVRGGAGACATAVDATAVSLPLYPALQDDEVGYTTMVFKEVLNRCGSND